METVILRVPLQDKIIIITFTGFFTQRLEIRCRLKTVGTGVERPLPGLWVVRAYY